MRAEEVAIIGIWSALALLCIASILYFLFVYKNDKNDGQIPASYPAGPFSPQLSPSSSDDSGYLAPQRHGSSSSSSEDSDYQYQLAAEWTGVNEGDFPIHPQRHESGYYDYRPAAFAVAGLAGAGVSLMNSKRPIRKRRNHRRSSPSSHTQHFWDENDKTYKEAAGGWQEASTVDEMEDDAPNRKRLYEYNYMAGNGTHYKIISNTPRWRIQDKKSHSLPGIYKVPRRRTKLSPRTPGGQVGKVQELTSFHPSRSFPLLNYPN